MLTELTVVIFSQYIHVSYHYVIHLKLIRCYISITYSSIKKTISNKTKIENGIIKIYLVNPDEHRNRRKKGVDETNRNSEQDDRFYSNHIK